MDDIKKNKIKYKIINFVSWFLFPLWIDTERINRKSHGINGYIKSIKFYHNCFVNAACFFGLKEALKIDL